MKSFVGLLSMIILVGCSQTEQKPKKASLSDSEKQQIENLSDRLVKSINSQDFSVINEFWSDDHFMVRVSTESKTQRSVLSHIFKTQIKQIIKTGNISIILDVSSGNGKAYISKINHFDDYSEIMLLLTFDDRFNFFKYRVELEKGKPVISDFMTLTDNLWYSEKISLSLEINSKYNAYSEERRIANSGISSARYYQDVGDIEAALEALKSIPRTHYGGNAISIEKLILASEISPEVYEEVLKTEFKYNKSLYMKYLYHYYFDSIKLETVYQELEDEIGSPFVLDTLVESGRFWN
jgi:hypothetical protein